MLEKIIVNIIIILLISSCGKYDKRLFINDRKKEQKKQNKDNTNNINDITL
ncbi:hypothetical protein Deia_01020 [Candidatus Deianiraea vastatrix]|uniref:Lipoprotein n=1 Tax=Candidatus Deianiraea vastatrix TaxID=2163644 RepID=A0A5B8XET9_9RICK|nr:hypothetical protein Deia_01020 [Candidatus Deianiraea vastatrix]